MFVQTKLLDSLWPDDTTSVDDFDPFDADLPGISVSERLRYLFLKVVIQNGANEWRSPDSPQFRVLALRSLYAAMIGFNRDNIPLLYPNGQPTSAELWLTNAQKTNGPSIRDRCCGHVFEKGETYYRCKYKPFLFVKLTEDNVVRIRRSSSVRDVSTLKTTVPIPLPCS
jgi:hypothetical protein